MRLMNPNVSGLLGWSEAVSDSAEAAIDSSTAQIRSAIIISATWSDKKVGMGGGGRCEQRGRWGAVDAMRRWGGAERQGVRVRAAGARAR